MTHYERLGVASDASAEEVRQAFRRAARESHPDRHGAESAAQMANVNEAWHVLGDPVRRHRYDDSLRQAEPTMPTAVRRREGDACGDRHEAPTNVEPARVPWKFLAAMAFVGCCIAILGVVVYEEPDASVPDGLLGPGSCVTLSAEFEAAEVLCTGDHDAVVDVVVGFGTSCPTGSEGFRDRQGLGTACVVRSEP